MFAVSAPASLADSQGAQINFEKRRSQFLFSFWLISPPFFSLLDCDSDPLRLSLSYVPVTTALVDATVEKERQWGGRLRGEGGVHKVSWRRRGERGSAQGARAQQRTGGEKMKEGDRKRVEEEEMKGGRPGVISEACT